MVKIEKTTIAYKCDRCGKEVDKKFPKDWRHVELSRGGELHKVKDYCPLCSGGVELAMGIDFNPDEQEEKEECPVDEVGNPLSVGDIVKLAGQNNANEDVIVGFNDDKTLVEVSSGQGFKPCDLRVLNKNSSSLCTPPGYEVYKVKSFNWGWVYKSGTSIVNGDEGWQSEVTARKGAWRHYNELRRKCENSKG